MYQSTEQFGNLINQDSRTFYALITVGDNTVSDGIRSIKFNGGSNRSDDFTIGSAVSQYVEVSVADNNIKFESEEILIQIGMTVNGIIEYIPMGYFTAETPETNEGEITFTAYDRMAKMDMPCFLSMGDTTTTLAILQEISQDSGVQIVTSGLASKPCLLYTSPSPRDCS